MGKEGLGLRGENFNLPGIIINDIKTDILTKQCVLYAETDFGLPETCPDCKVHLHSHSSKKVRINNVPINGRHNQIELIKHRKRCHQCGQVFSCAQLPFVTDKHYLTKLLVDSLIEYGMRETFKDVQDFFGISDSTAQRVLSDYFAKMDKEHKFVLPYALGLDEVKIGRMVRTSVTNLERRTLVNLLPHRQGNFLIEAFEKRYSEAERALVRWVCTDMYLPFEQQVMSLFPNAEWVVATCHVIRFGNETLDEIYQSLQTKLSDPKLVRVGTKRLRTLLSKREQDLTPYESKKLTAIGIGIPELKTAYEIKEKFLQIFEHWNRNDAEASFADWESKLPPGAVYEPFRNVASKIHQFYEPIFRYWDTSGLVNSYTECARVLANSIDSRVKGMRFEMLRGMLLYEPKAIDDGTSNQQEFGAKLYYTAVDADNDQT